jgi:flagellar biosynthesis protein FlhG
LIPGGSGVEKLANFSIEATPHVFDKIREMDKTLDFMLIDTAAGIADNFSDITTNASEVIVVVAPDSTSIVDAYSAIKTILRREPGKPVSIVVSDIVGVHDAEQVYRRISAVVSEFLDQRLNFLGTIPHDPQVQEAIRQRVPVVEYAPNSPASRAIRLIAKRIHDQGRPEPDYSVVRSFRDQLAENQ